MIYKDRAYGEIEITEPVILELIDSAELQRLKNIDQKGYFEPFFPGKCFSRFEHSIGVHLLLKRYDASLEEQIAGLIHDVSHTVFSHCVDFLLGRGSKHNYQDEIFDNFVRSSSLPAILKKYNISLEYILNEENFPLKENHLPDLCADRMDYSLREAIIFNEIGESDIKEFFNNLTVIENQWVFKTFETAQNYAKLFSVLNNNYWCSLKNSVMFLTVKEYLQHGLRKKYITRQDLFSTDEEVLEKINKYLDTDERLQALLMKMNNRVPFENNPEGYDNHIITKSRVIDPLCEHDGKIQKVSDINPEWKGYVTQELKPKEYFIKFKNTQ